MLRRAGWLLGLCLLLVSPLLAAQNVPQALRDWQGWVLHDAPRHALCPLLVSPLNRMGGAPCAWPGRLILDAGSDGARFSFDVHVDAPSWVALPGDAHAWPQQVDVNNQPATVMQRGGTPQVWLEKGDYRLSGSLPWQARPAQLRVPPAIGLVSLRIDGKPVVRVERHGDQLTLGETAASQKAADALSVRVYRRLTDGLPAVLQTQVQLNVAGSAREQVLGPVLPAGFVATALAGPLPARLESDGRLRVQLRPGQWTLTLTARSVAPLHKVTLGAVPAPWPKQETWSYADDTDLRVTRVRGQAVDAAQAGVPDDWQDLPAFTLDKAAGLEIEQVSRAGEGGRGDQLRLRREIWLDFNGGGLSAVDHLSGTLRHRQRLEVGAPWVLQRAAQDGDPVLVTTGKDGQRGVEVRTTGLALDAGLSLPSARAAIPSTAWRLALESIDATVHLPPGYRLLSAPGADRSPDSWVARWSLLDLFVVALIVLLAGRLLGWPWALLAAGFLVLAQHEAGAPRWTLALAIALALLVRALPEGRLRLGVRIAAAASFVLAVLWTLPFAITQMQYALHPQLEGGLQARAPAPKIMKRVAPPPAPPPPVEEQAVMSMSSSPPAPPAPPQDISGNGPSQDLADVMTQTDSHSVIQAGAGTPHWDYGNDYRLGWSGPVTPAQTTRLVIAPAWLVRLLRVLMVGLLAVLLGRLVPLLLMPLRARWMGARGAAAGAALLVMALLPYGAHAQGYPSEQLLNQLRSRLTEAPKCSPNCAAVPQAVVQIDADTLRVTLETHADATVAVPLPQASDALHMTEVDVDGHNDAPLLHQDRQLLLRMQRGVHRVGLRYRIADADSVSLRFILHPQRIALSGPGWSADGVDDNRLLGDNLTFNRIRNGSDGKALPPAQSFPPYVRLDRRLVFGVDWKVYNEVDRIAPREGGFSVTLPLLPGEHPIGDDLLVKDGHIQVTFKAGQDAVRWQSRIDTFDRLSLSAPTLGERAEVWELAAAPMWHVDAQGVPASIGEQGWTYRPLPGEKLQLAITRPAPAAGASLAFDHAGVAGQVGERTTETTLSLLARSTRGGEHAIGLPTGSELLEARRDDEPVSLVIRNDKLSLPLLPGSHTYTIRLREPGGSALRVRTPDFALGAPAANIDVSLQLPRDRWVLWAWGPAMGPAVLYWSQLAVLLLVAWLLARYAPTPLRFRHWLLLGLGFSAFAWSAYALVIAWMILLGLRARSAVFERMERTLFNLLQIGLAVFTLLALIVLIAAVPYGLLGQPDMHVLGNGSTAWMLRWFADRTGDVLPRAGVFSLPLWVYKLAMLAWALWLANALIGWLRWAFEAWARGGYWRGREPKKGSPADA